MLIVVASKNPAKLIAVETGFGQVFPEAELKVLAVEVDSEVPDQPMSDDETRQGSINRVRNAKKLNSEADFWVGLEGGIGLVAGQMHSFAWISVLEKENKISSTRTATFTLPELVVKEIDAGLELGHAMDKIHSDHNLKQKQGAVGVLTKGIVSRTDLYLTAIITALVPFFDAKE